MFFLQMAGFPGSGKSTLSKEISRLTGAVIIDHDIVKSALMDGMESNQLDTHVSGAMAYDLEWALIDFHLSHNHDVLHDSPCFYKEGLERGSKLANKHHASYKYVECFLDDALEIDKRLKKRKPMRSQINQISSVSAFNEWKGKSVRPSGDNYLVVSTDQPLQHYLNDVIQYLQT